MIVSIITFSLVLLRIGSPAQGFSVQLQKKNVTCVGLTDGKASVMVSGTAAQFTVQWFGTTFNTDSVSMNPVADNTIYESGGNLSNGAGEYMPIGKSGNGFLHRGLVKFPVDGSLPPLSEVSAAVLRMNLSNTSGSAGPKVIQIHKVLQDWGEGTSDAGPQAGHGSPATVNDATWSYRYFSTISWNTPGGDFNTTVSAQTTVNNPALYTWSGAGLVADVQSWLDGTSANNGWMLIGQETGTKSGKRFDARENSIPANRPLLKLYYQYPALMSNQDSVFNLAPGIYTVVVTDAMNQDTTIQFEITSPVPLSSSVEVTNATCLLSNGSAQALISGGVQPYVFNWSNGGSGSLLTQLQPGIYILQAVDSAGCIIQDTAVINNTGLPDSSLVSDTACTVYTWNGMTFTMPGLYTHYLTNAAGCDSISRLQLHLTYTFADTVIIDPPQGQSGLCPTGSIVLKAYPLSDVYTYSWSNGIAADSVIISTPQDITVTVTDLVGCSKSSAPFSVTEGYRDSDFNHDGITNTQDFLQLLSLFGQSCANCSSDLDQSGIIDVADFLQLVASFNQGCL
jgi:hypothetical protein